MRVRPLTHHIYVKTEKPEEATASGIIIPETAQQNRGPIIGVVVDLGPGYVQDDGSHKPIEGITRKDRLVIQPYAGMEHTFEGETFLVIAPRDVIGVIEDASN